MTSSGESRKNSPFTNEQILKLLGDPKTVASAIKNFNFLLELLKEQRYAKEKAKLTKHATDTQAASQEEAAGKPKAEAEEQI